LSDEILKHIVIALCLTAGGITAMVLGYEETAGFCFGGLAGYVIKNGVVKK